LAAFVGEEAKQLIDEMHIEAADVPVLIENIKKWFAFYGGSGCEAITFGQDGKMDVSYIMEVKDEAGALNLLKNMEKDMAPFFTFYESIGMPMTFSFKEKVRESDGLVIHQLATTIKMEELPAEQREQMEAMGVANMVYDITVRDGLMFYAGEGKVEALVHRYSAQTNAAPIKARSVYPAGGNYYMDLDIGDYMAFAASMVPDSPETAVMKQQMATLFSGVAPITSAGFKKDGCLMWSINIPGGIIAKYGQMAMMIQMQQMQMNAPQAMPAP